MADVEKNEIAEGETESGSIHLNDCPVEHYIPIYLIVGGCFGVGRSVLTLVLRTKNQVEENEQNSRRPNPINTIVSLFLLAWLIAGAVWVYGNFAHVNTSDPTSSQYCHFGTFWFAFALITFGIVVVPFAICCLLCIGAAALCS